MTYQQLWTVIHWPNKRLSEREAEIKFDDYWQGHANEREVRDHWESVIAVVQAVINETEGCCG